MRSGGGGGLGRKREGERDTRISPPRACVYVYFWRAPFAPFPPPQAPVLFSVLEFCGVASCMWGSGGRGGRGVVGEINGAKGGVGCVAAEPYLSINLHSSILLVWGPDGRGLALVHGPPCAGAERKERNEKQQGQAKAVTAAAPRMGRAAVLLCH